MKRRNKILLTIIALLLIGFCVWYFKFRKKEDKIIIHTEKVHYGNISNSIMATGTIQPVDTVAVGTQVSGTIKKLYADNNSVVKKGELLAELDPSLFNAQVQQFNASLAQAKSNLAYQQSNFNRQQELYNAGAISKAAYEVSLNQYQVAQENVKGVNAQLASANQNLSYSRIYSPIDGTVLLRSVSEGQTVAASFNTPTLFMIAKDLTKMQVKASVDEADIGNVQAGQRSSFNVDAFPNDTFSGTVMQVFLSPVVTSNVVTYSTMINAPNDNLKLKPGMTANISIYVKEDTNILLIPSKSTKFNPDASLEKRYKIISIQDRIDAAKAKNGGALPGNGAHKHISKDSTALVWIQRNDSLIQKRIKTGMTDDVNVEVLSGLAENDNVITNIEVESSAAGSSDTQGQSPFMPRRRSNNQKGNTGGGR